ncbi:nitroreductase/quinone reductase family protein [Actinomadura hibisca]|uniref:nitroreductase/quinone reductase family protein n=1 Tax=Actinomadura hibisca TaxID=68565 RepID=UPI0008324075|nr:nitroreductase/quinone reductase family protein [Actinomadura hibisca]
MSNPFNEKVIAEFRANQGRVGGQFDGSTLLLLTTTGARTGLERTTPLVYLPDGDRLVVFASNGGAPTSPAWFHNLVKTPHATVEVGPDKYEARVDLVDEAEHDALWARQIERDPAFAGFRTSERVVPVVALTRA